MTPISGMQALMLAQMHGSDGPTCYPDGGDHRVSFEGLVERGLVREVERPQDVERGHRCFVFTREGAWVAADLADDPTVRLGDDTNEERPRDAWHHLECLAYRHPDLADSPVRRGSVPLVDWDRPGIIVLPARTPPLGTIRDSGIAGSCNPSREGSPTAGLIRRVPVRAARRAWQPLGARLSVDHAPPGA